MPLVDVADETFLVAAPQTVAAVIADPARWRSWWPDLNLVVFMDRGLKGVRWTVTGALVGSCEIWLEPYGDGVIAHHYLRADPTRPGSDTEPLAASPRRLARRGRRLSRQRVVAWKAVVNALKDELEAGRAPGVGRVA